jgi:hypothetical protein
MQSLLKLVTRCFPEENLSNERLQLRVGELDELSLVSPVSAVEELTVPARLHSATCVAAVVVLHLYLLPQSNSRPKPGVNGMSK